MAPVVIRFATPADMGLILGLVRELAHYERQPGAVTATEEDLRRYGFGPDRRFEALLAFSETKPAGFALFFPNFSTWLGRPGLFLEDIYVAEWARKHGVGRRLMARLAAIALERGWGRLDLNVLHWNPAREFYARIGMHPREDWIPYRVTGAALERLATQAKES